MQNTEPPSHSSPPLEVGRGLVAGLAATAAMSFSQNMEMKLTGRGPSATPAEAVCLVLGVETRTDPEKQRLANEAHWVYGITWGIGHSIAQVLPEPARTPAYFAAIWGAGVALLSVTGLAPPPTKWALKSLASDLIHHAVYVVVGSVTYNALRGLPTQMSAAARARQR